MSREGRFLQAAAESVKYDGVGVAMVLVVAWNDHDGLRALLEPSQSFVKPGKGVKIEWAVA
jgi:hypothetical protein